MKVSEQNQKKALPLSQPLKAYVAYLGFVPTGDPRKVLADRHIDSLFGDLMFHASADAFKRYVRSVPLAAFSAAVYRPWSTSDRVSRPSRSAWLEFNNSAKIHNSRRLISTLNLRLRSVK